MTVIRALFNQNNEVYMVDTSGWTIKEKVVAVAANKKLFSCIVGRSGSDGAQASVISKRYWDISKGAGDVLDDGSVDVLVNVSISRTNSFDVDIPGDDTATVEALRENLKRAATALSSSRPGGGELAATPVHSSALGNPDKQRFQELCIKATATVEDLEAKLTPGPKRARESTLAARGIPVTQDNILADRYRGYFLSPTPTSEAQSK